MKLQFTSIAFLVGFGLLQPVVGFALGPIVIGPGSHSLIYETNNVDYHILDGTQILSPSLTGPPSTFVVVTDAMEFRGGGNTQIDGGYFKGGNATYSGTDNAATAAGGNALHLRQSTGEIYGGTFLGGDATSSVSGITSAGNGLYLYQSDLVIYGGHFEGGTLTYPYLGGPHVLKAQGAEVAAGSLLELHGGEFVGDLQIDSGASLWVFGTDLSYVGTTLSGKYADGTPFSENVPRIGGTVLFNPVVTPEPSVLVLVSSGTVILASGRYIRRRRRTTS